MLGLPSTTEVGRRLPKEAFYRNLKLDARTRDEFVHLIEHIEIANSIKVTTANIADGERVHEIMVLEVELKGTGQPERAMEAIARANPHKLVFFTTPGNTCFLLRKRLRSNNKLDELVLAGGTLDAVWDSLCAQVVFDDKDGSNIDERIELAARKAVLEEEIAKLDARCRKERQINRRNELFVQLRTKQRELRALASN